MRALESVASGNKKTTRQLTYLAKGVLKKLRNGLRRPFVIPVRFDPFRSLASLFFLTSACYDNHFYGLLLPFNGYFHTKLDITFDPVEKKLRIKKQETKDCVIENIPKFDLKRLTFEYKVYKLDCPVSRESCFQDLSEH